MTQVCRDAEELVDRILAAPRSGRRRLVALAGAPASGKSTLAETLTTQLCDRGCQTALVPMDGFHLHNPILADRGLLHRKGAPETFDAAGFLHLVSRLSDEDDIYYPVFDRSRDIAIAGAGQIENDCGTVIIEGNYLLFDAPIWRDLSTHWDLSLYLSVPIDILKARLVDRWLTQGLSDAQAETRASGNDLVNAQLIESARRPADVTVQLDDTAIQTTP